jgi:hypothetical protein
LPGSRSVKIIMSNAGSGPATRAIFLVIIAGAGQIPYLYNASIIIYAD